MLLLTPSPPPCEPSLPLDAEPRYRAVELQMPGGRSEAHGGPFCLILPWRGVDERISYARELSSIANLSLHLIYQGEGEWVIQRKQSIGGERRMLVLTCFHWARGASVPLLSPRGFQNNTDVTHDFVSKCNTCALSLDRWVSFHYC